MRFVTYIDSLAGDHPDRVGVLSGDQIYALTPGVTLRALLGDDGERLHRAGEQALSDPRDVLPLDGVRLRAPLPDPPSIRDFMTFEQHVEGILRLAGAEIPPQWYNAPAFYFTNPAAVLAPHDDVPVPPGSDLFDLELEAAAVIGLGGRDVRAAEAERHIVGYCLLNDWSARGPAVRGNGCQAWAHQGERHLYDARARARHSRRTRPAPLRHGLRLGDDRSGQRRGHRHRPVGRDALLLRRDDRVRKPRHGGAPR